MNVVKEMISWCLWDRLALCVSMTRIARQVWRFYIRVILLRHAQVMLYFKDTVSLGPEKDAEMNWPRI